MKKENLLSAVLIIIVAVLIIFNAVQLRNISTIATPSKNDMTVYDRVMKSGIIKAGYIVYPPGSIKDPNTNKLQGVFVETLEEAAKNMGLKVEWTEEVGWGTMIEGLQSNRYDIVGTAIWPTSARGKLVDFATPLSYSVLGAFVRNDDNRFDTDIQKINNPNIKLATIDGEISQIVAKNRFPKGNMLSSPQSTDISQMLLDITQSKADVAFVEPYIATVFMKNNPGKLLKNVASKPLLVYGNSMMFKNGQEQFKTMINTALAELINSGFVDSVIDKYNKDYPDAYYKVAPPYNMSSQK